MVDQSGSNKRSLRSEPSTRVTLLVDNHVDRRGLLAEHGLSWLIQRGEESALFDTGQGFSLQHNAMRLGIELGRLDAVVLSHGHYDHTGAFRAVIELAPGASFYAHPGAFEQRFAKRSPNEIAEIGMPAPAELRRLSNSRLRETLSPTEVLPELWATGQIPRCSGCHALEDYFYLDELAQKPDPIVDDQALFFDSDRGLVVILGCAHSGVICTLNHIRTLRPGRPFYAVLGGMHMGRADTKQRRRTLEALVELQVERVVPAHCTGMPFVSDLLGAFGPRCQYPSVGGSWTFETGVVPSSDRPSKSAPGA